jgi:hypothetical protein
MFTHVSAHKALIGPPSRRTELIDAGTKGRNLRAGGEGRSTLELRDEIEGPKVRDGRRWN